MIAFYDAPPPDEMVPVLWLKLRLAVGGLLLEDEIRLRCWLHAIENEENQ